MLMEMLKVSILIQQNIYNMQMILSHDLLTAKRKQMNAVKITRIYLGIAKV